MATRPDRVTVQCSQSLSREMALLYYYWTRELLFNLTDDRSGEWFGRVSDELRGHYIHNNRHTTRNRSEVRIHRSIDLQNGHFYRLVIACHFCSKPWHFLSFSIRHNYHKQQIPFRILTKYEREKKSLRKFTQRFFDRPILFFFVINIIYSNTFNTARRPL